ncbi:MAG TPA: MotA/TolQ/ExbB proton channel family protein [Candidatus Omnitrophota bacterium]|nr:MotA/TolQ/ExbB proton channel family protein [Candidatus Omnitrophota bacterium]HPT06539.1 MotA/TolQ/ExbB proton channel family protein [Candidatus Omnitrophota bacterium]
MSSTLNAWQLFLAGGPMMFPLVLCSIVAVTIIIEKSVMLWRISQDSQELLSALLEKVKRHQIKEALELCEKSKTPVSHVLKAGILKYDRSRPQIKEAIEDASLYEIPQLERNLPILATVAHIAPLLGLLGTVLGMVKCFYEAQSRAQSAGVFTALDLSGGLWQALVTTAFGLAVAILAFVAYNYFVAKVNACILDMEKSSTELVNFLTE